ncbi:tetratricopeptide repeat-containing sulfotransferase family protein [Salinimonas sediminis]|uniref:Sulfotransferase family protein n=1 Tax=Salinimonas sediminis TaxID=2303538 RepID=A0A346NSI5_9ALTE|nr:tetratricopeptide repeat-containing sulfotransferase family protein [Salinimonas sediminis]AXR08492.1 sulfotransferase family protein [Salinimonas sediminis]
MPTTPTATQTIKHAIATGSSKQAIRLCEQALAALPSNSAPDTLGHEQTDLLYLQAVAYRLAGEPSSALSVLQRLQTIQPDYGRAYQEQAYCYRALQRPEEAAAAFYQATRFNPALLSAWQQLVEVYRAQNNKTALDIAQHQCRYLSQLPKALLGAYDLMYEGQLYKAEQVCRQFLARHKHDVEAMLLLGELGMRTKVYHDAEFLLESCVSLYPQEERALVAYQALLLKLGKYTKAVALAKRRLAAAPQHSGARHALAEGLSGIGRVEEASALYQQLLAEKPDAPAVWLSLGHVLKSAGKLAQAIDAYEQAAHYQNDCGDAYWSLANTKTYRFSPPWLEAMQQHEAHPATGLDNRIHFCFALGKAMEDAGEYSRAFDYYQRGNALKKSTLAFSISRTEDALARQQQICQASLFSSTAGAANTDPIFIVGLPRAGSTLLEQILSSHSQIDGTMELHDILGIASQLSGQAAGYPEALLHLSDEQCEALGKRYIEQTRVYRQGAPFFIDKMPNNFAHIGLIKRILPNAKIIDARREPLACCFSGYKQLFGDGQEFSYALSDIGRYYKAYVALMDHWHKVLPGQILTVKHEDVLDDLAGQVTRMLDYLGLDFEPACLNFHATKRAIKTPSSEQVRQPLYQSGRHQYKPFIPFLTPLYDALEIPSAAARRLT